MRRYLVTIVWLFLCQAAAAKAPNIVFVLADDLGWNDVGYHNPQMVTPSIDALADDSVRLENFHVNPMCTPTRASFLTGKPAGLVGMSNDVLPPWSEAGLDPSVKTIADRLKTQGYFTAIIGKWNMGHARPSYRPLQRGFDYQFGPYAASVEYFNHTYPNTAIHDLFRQDKPYHVEGYLTDLLGLDAKRLIEQHDFTQPLFLYLPFTAPHGGIEVPRYYVRPVGHIKDQDRRYYAAMVYALDVAVGHVIRALKERGQWDNTLFVFSSDNGGQAQSVAPLRGGKRTLFEGGLRTPTLMHFPQRLGSFPTVDQHLFKLTDLTATFVRMGGEMTGDVDKGHDGVDIAAVLRGQVGLPDARILHIDDRSAAVVYGNYKVMENPDRHQINGDDDRVQPAVYDLQHDPLEQVDLSESQPQLLERFAADVQQYRAQMPPPVASSADWQQAFRWSTIPVDSWWDGNLAKLDYAQRIWRRFYPGWPWYVAFGAVVLMGAAVGWWFRSRELFFRRRN